jgi:hypothetical protein
MDVTGLLVVLEGMLRSAISFFSFLGQNNVTPTEHDELKLYAGRIWPRIDDRLIVGRLCPPPKRCIGA